MHYVKFIHLTAVLNGKCVQLTSVLIDESVITENYNKEVIENRTNEGPFILTMNECVANVYPENINATPHRL